MKQEHGVEKKKDENFTEQEGKIAQQIRRKPFSPPSSLHFKRQAQSQPEDIIWLWSEILMVYLALFYLQ